jgi:hypothetical protein
MCRRCHWLNWPHATSRLLGACLHLGPTLFDELVDIIQDHGPGGRRADDAVRLVLD